MLQNAIMCCCELYKSSSKRLWTNISPKNCQKATEAEKLHPEATEGVPTGNPETPSPKLSHIYKDHSYSTLQSPRTVTRRLDILYDHVSNLNKKVKTLQQKSLRLSKKVTNLQEVGNTLRNENRVSANAADMLSKTFSDVPADVMKRMVANESSGKLSRKTYPPALRAFALT
ncbi:uncharacterized protein LOC121414257 [Lytechinus variegatus]|uniref:uncharacterized protein LOC121414257 n=1 Tax=Lytechinus variegatus TaxID=7654 RepID=UPI001BB19179|nr:uncharacterized protein LOC121414257 [Lytechinus variegatus]